MKERHCDRCGKTFVPKGYNDDGEHDDCYYPRIRVTVTPKPDGVHWLEELEKTYDLCDECHEQLKRWLIDEGTKNNKNAEKWRHFELTT